MMRKTVIELEINVEEARKQYMACQFDTPIILFGEKYVIAELTLEESPDITSKIHLMRVNND